MNISKLEATTKPQGNSNTDGMKDSQTVINELTSNVKTGPKPKGFFHPQSLLKMSTDSTPIRTLGTFDAFDVQQNNHTDLSSQKFYPFYHDHMLANQAYYWSHWNMSPMACEAYKMRTLSSSFSFLSNREHNPALTKTKICDHWRRSGSCSYGDSCWYAHGEDDLRKVSLSRSHRTVDDKVIGETERNFSQAHRCQDGAKEDALKVNKHPDEFKASPPPKRVSTNVKGLTVNIPSNIAFKEQPPTDSMPLSPAQERWISMSVGSNFVTPSSNLEKNSDSVDVSSSSKITMKNCSENEHEERMENVLERRSHTGKFLRDDDSDEFGFLSPNPFPYPQAPAFSNGFCTQNTTINSNHRSYSRGPHQRNFAAHPFGGFTAQQPTIPAKQEHAHISRSGYVNSSCFERNLSAQNSSSSTHTSRENLHHPVPNGPPPQFQQAIWNVAGEIYQRQKDIETCGLRSSVGQHNMQPRESDINRLLSKLKQKDLSCLRFMIENGFLNEREIPRQSELTNSGFMSSLPTPPPSMSTQFLSNNIGLPNSDQNVSDCSCRNTRQKVPYDSNAFSNFNSFHHQQRAHVISQQHQQFHPHSQHQLFRQHGISPFSGSMTGTSELAAPPKIFESLLPSDESFSIWLDSKPKKESAGFIQSSHGIDNSISDASLLTKMEVLRSEKFPISEEEMEASKGTEGIVPKDKRSNSECSSPPVLSLMELLSSENLLEETDKNQKTTMFDFDTLKITETLRGVSQYSAQSSQTSSSKSPLFFLVDEKTPNTDDHYTKSSGLYTPLTGQTPSFMEQCDFFAAAGSCPFGEGCQLSHATSYDQQQLESL